MSNENEGVEQQQASSNQARLVWCGGGGEVGSVVLHDMRQSLRLKLSLCGKKLGAVG